MNRMIDPITFSAKLCHEQHSGRRSNFRIGGDLTTCTGENNYYQVILLGIVKK